MEKVQAAITIQDVTSLDIYVKAEEGKAYYVVNGEAAGTVDLFWYFFISEKYDWHLSNILLEGEAPCLPFFLEIYRTDSFE